MQGNRPTAASDSYLAELGWTRSGRRNGWAHHNAAIRCLRCQVQGYSCTHSKIQIVSERAGGGLRLGRCEECRDEDRSKGPCEAAGRLDATRWVYQRNETATKPQWIKTIRDPKGGRRQLKGDREEMTSARIEEDSPETEGGGTATSLAEIGLDLGGSEQPRELEVEASSHQGVDDVELPRETAMEAVDTQEPDFYDLGHETYDHHEDDSGSVSSDEPHRYGHDDMEKEEALQLSSSLPDQDNEPKDYHELLPSVRTPFAVAATRRDPLSYLGEPTGRQQHLPPGPPSTNHIAGQALNDPTDQLDLGDHLARDTYPASPAPSIDVLQSAQCLNIGQDPSMASRSRSSTTRLRATSIGPSSEVLSASPEVQTGDDGIDIIESTLLATNIHGPVADHIVDVVDEAGTLKTSFSILTSDITITRQAGHAPVTTLEGSVPIIVKEVTDANHTTIGSTLFHPGSITEGWTGWELLAAFRDHYPLHKLKPETWHLHNQVERIIERGHRPVDALDPALYEFVLHNARPQHLTHWGRSRLRAMINLLTPESPL